MERKIRWVSIPGSKGLFQISTNGKVRRILKVLEKYGMQLYSKDLFGEVEIEFRTRQFFSTKANVPVVKINLNDEGKKEYTIASLMMLSFYGIRQLDITEIIHIDGDEFNNNLENLIVANHIIKRRYFTILRNEDPTDRNLEFQLSKYGASIKQRISMYDYNGNLKEVFTSLNELVHAHNLSRIELQKYLIGMKTGFINERFFVKGDGPRYLDLSYLIEEFSCHHSWKSNGKNTLIFQYAKDGKLVEIFESIAIVSKRLHISIGNLENSIENRGQIGNYFWVQKKIEDSNYFAEN